MLYKFKSPAAGDLIMLEPNGRRVLEAIGKDAGPQGIILAADMGAAISALEQAVAQEDADHKAAVALAESQGEAAPKQDAVSLRQRALPFIEMLKRCSTAGKDMVWGV